MSFKEKIAWSFGASTLLTYFAYLMVVINRARDCPLTEVAYVGPMLWSIALSIAITVIVSVVAALPAPEEVSVHDERDTIISRYSDAVGLWILSVAVLGALGLAMLHAAHFWIANAIYLALVLSSVGSTGTKLLAYQRGFRPW